MDIVETGRLQFGGLAVWGRQTVDPTGTTRQQQTGTAGEAGRDHRPREKESIASAAPKVKSMGVVNGLRSHTDATHQQAPTGTERTAVLVFEIHGLAVELILTAKPSNLPMPRCGPGEYAENVGSSACASCPLNTISAMPKDSAATCACAPGYFSPFAADVQDC